MAEQEPKAGKRKYRISLSGAIAIGLVLGVITGLFLGDMAAHLAIIGEVYIGLLQMSILPYMVASLVGGIGQLSFEKAGRLALTGGVVLIASWLLALVVIYGLSLAFPQFESGSFFSASMVQAANVDFVALYIPKNPFNSLATSVIPAVAVFSVALGVALIGVQNKELLLKPLEVITRALTRIALMVVKLTPIGVFAISANAAGTLTIEELGRLQVYLVEFITAALLLTFWILPGIVAALTPFRYCDILRASRAALLTGFVTGNLFIVLPVLIENCKELFREYGLIQDDTDSYIEVLIPTSFNFPNIGKLLTLLFVMFAGWYTGNHVTLDEFPRFSLLGIFTLFGGVDLALPFLLDQMRIPSDMYQLYVVTGVINGWFATLLAVMNLFAFTLLATCVASGSMTWRWNSLARYIVISLIVMLATVGAMRSYFSTAVKNMVSDVDLLAQMKLESEVVEAVVLEQLPADSLPDDMSRVDAIRQRGTLRVGFIEDILPFAYFNGEQQLVGHDVEIMHILAASLGVRLEFYRVSKDREQARQAIDQDRLDIIIGGLMTTASRIVVEYFSRPYMEANAAVLTLDHRRHDFKSWNALPASKDLKLAAVGEGFSRDAQRFMPNIEIKVLREHSDFFTEAEQDTDGLITSAETASAWTIKHPHYAVSIPKPHIRLPVAFILPHGESDFAHFVNSWIGLQRTTGTFGRIYDHWVLGKRAEQRKPRWSIIRDVLHWIE